MFTIKEKGIVLAKALIIMALLFILGVSGLTIAKLGFETQGAEIAFLRAKQAAEDGLLEAAMLVSNQGSCSFSTSDRPRPDGSKFSYRMRTDSAQRICFIWSEGKFGNAKVVVTSYVSYSNAEYGAMDVRTNPVITLGGSSSIANCDPRCPGPALVYGGTLNYNGTTSTQCQNNNKGIVGNPAIISSDTSDRVQRYFCNYISGICDDNHPCNSNPQGNKASNEAELFNNVYQRFAPQLRVSGMDTISNNGNFSDFNTIETNLRNNLPSQCKSTSTTDCTLNGATITCGKGNNVKVISLNNCSEVYLAGKLEITGGVLPTGRKIFVSQDIEAKSAVNLSGSTLINRGNVILSDQVESGNIVSERSVSATDSLTDLNLFVKENLTLAPKTGNNEVSGGFVYVRGNLAIDGKGNYKVGTMGDCDNPSTMSDPNAKPVLMLTRGNINITGQGTTSINGFLFSWGSQMTISGNLNINGGFVVNNDENFSITNNTGNAAINFNYCIYETLRKYFYCGLLKPINCTGGTTPYPSLLRSKAIQF